MHFVTLIVPVSDTAGLRLDGQAVASQLVLLEASVGDREAARLRLDLLKGFPLTSSTESVEWVASELADRGLVPPNAAVDGFHIAYAAAHYIDCLLTWNCRHIANAERLPAIEKFLADNGFSVPIV